MRRLLFIITSCLLLCSIAFALDTVTCPGCKWNVGTRIVHQDSTCTESGFEQSICRHCGYIISETVLPPIGHNYKKDFDNSFSPTCVSPGLFTYVCQNGCGSQYYEELPLGDHMLVIKHASPTCTEDGSEFTFCQVCGEEFGTVVIPATGHQYEAVPDQEDTYECTKCGHSYSDGPPKEIPPFIPDPACEHSWVCVRSAEPTAERKGYREYECTYCGITKTEYIHKLPVIPGVDFSQEEIPDAGSPVASDVESIGKSVFSGVWKLFGINVPGFGFTFGQMYFGIALCSLSVVVARLLFGLGGGGSSYRTGSTDNPKISKERRNDQF